MSVKILHIISSLTRGGRERQLAIIVANSDLKQYPTRIIYFNKHENSYLDEYGLTDVVIQVKSHGKFARLIELHQIIKNEKPNIVYTWGNGESVSILILKYFHNFKFINASVRHGIRSKKFSHYFRTFVLHLSQHVVANSKAGLKANNLQRGHVLYNGIEKKFLKPLSNRKEERQLLTEIPENTPIFISVANLVPYKDYKSVLKALKIIRDENYSLHYLILGDGSMRKEIEYTIQAYDLSDYVRIIGNVENVSDYLKVSDIFIHSSKGEGCSNAILEAMAAVLPIIASDTGGTSEIVSNENGLLFEYKNSQQLVQQVKYLLANKSQSVQMGEKSFKKIKDRFTVDVMMKNYYEIIDRVVNG